MDITLLKSIWWIALLLASVSDVRNRKVPNSLNFSYLFCGVIYQLLTSSNIVASMWFSLQGVLCALLILIIPFALYVYRAGDVKLCMAAGAWLGAEMISYAIAYAVILGGLWGVVKILCLPKSDRTQRLQNLQSVLYTKQMPSLELNTHSSQYIPMAFIFSASIFYCGYSYIF